MSPGARGGGGSNYTGSFSGTASVTPVVQVPNNAPTANAGPNQTTPLGRIVTLDGTGSSDADGDTLTYTWSFVSVPSGSTAVLAGANTAHATFTDDKPGNYVIRLVVNDGMENSDVSNVTVSTSNTAPVANAGPNQAATTGQTIQLDSSASADIDGDALTYTWSLISRPDTSAAVLSSTSAVKPTFVVDVKGAYVAQLIVNDGQVDSPASTVTITDHNSAPAANAGTAQTVLVNSIVHLDGSNSSDIDGDALTFQWTIVNRPEGSNAGLSDPTSINPTFVADEPEDYTISLIVNDGTSDSAPVSVKVSTTNSAPVANAGLDQSVVLGATVLLDGSASSDPSLAQDVRFAKLLGAEDIRVNQEQVNGAGVRVGRNRPDLQFTLRVFARIRVYIEYDPVGGGRVAGHQSRILSNDPFSIILSRTF